MGSSKDNKVNQISSDECIYATFDSIIDGLIAYKKITNMGIASKYKMRDEKTLVLTKVGTVIPIHKRLISDKWLKVSSTEFMEKIGNMHVDNPLDKILAKNRA